MSEKKDSSELLQFSKRQVTGICGVLFLVGAAIFIAGYFLGSYQTIEQFVIKSEQESFADQVYASLSALYDQESAAPKIEAETEADGGSSEDVSRISESPTAMAIDEIQKKNDVSSAVQEIPAQPLEELDEEDDAAPEDMDEREGDTKNSVDSFELVHPSEAQGKRWYAQLIGYGLEKSAREFAQKLTKQGFDVTIAPRKSQNAGRQRTWYQVVTSAYENRDLLQKQVDKIVSLEKLKGVQISTC